MNQYKEYLGESIGTFILVLFGCGSVAVELLFEGFNSLLEIALIWGIGVTIAIFSVRNICPAHLNPAVSTAMFISKKLTLRKLPGYILSQFLGAVIAGGVLFVAFDDAIAVYEQTNSIVRGSSESYRTAKIFGEFFPNPNLVDRLTVSPLFASIMEALGTFILVFVIFRLTEKEKQVDNLTPILIGATVSLIICLVAPFTQAGLNPARDFGPRIVAYFTGWGTAALPPASYSFFTVYILSPIIGGIMASLANKALK